MRPIAHLVAAVAAMTLLGADALAASVTCQSRNNQREECWLQGRGEVVLVRQISKTACVKGRNWDETRNGLYVTDGCGGVFETRGSWDNNRPGQGGGWDNRPGQGHNQGYNDLLGVRASSGEQELRRRGYRDTRSEPAPGGRFVFWRTPQRGCIEVRVADGRFQTIRPVNNNACDDNRPNPPPRPMPGQANGPSVSALFACNKRLNNDGQDGIVDRQTRVRPGVWELVLSIPSGRYICTVTDQGQVVSFQPYR
jgi:Protein of unknown function (DUF3011)